MKTSALIGCVVLCMALGACNCGTDTGSDAGFDAGPACPAQTGVVVEHSNDITTEELWPGDGTTHLWTTGATIRPGGSITVAACGVVQVRPNISFTLRGSAAAPARFITLGTQARPVTITSVPGSGPWGALLSTDGNLRVELAWTTLENGGAGGLHGSTISLNGAADPGTTVTPMLKVDHVTVKNSQGTGVVLAAGAAFSPDSVELSVLGGGDAGVNASAAIEIGQLAAGTLPTLHVSGNANDLIRVSAAPATLNIARDLTLKDRGVPYYFYFDRVRVTDPQGTAVPTLTLEAGVELRFDDYLMVGTPSHPGKLVAQGTPAAPVLFTSAKATRAPGDWPGIWLHEAAGSHLENVLIDYAGGTNGISSSNCKPAMSSDNASLFISEAGSTYVPAASDFSAVRIDHASSHALNAMWRAPSFGPDLTAGFSFGAIGGCRQTKNSTPTGCMNAEGCLVP